MPVVFPAQGPPVQTISGTFSTLHLRRIGNGSALNPSGASTFDHRNGTKARNFLCDAGAVYHAHHFLHVLVCLRRLFGKAGKRAGRDRDTARLEFLFERVAAHLPFCLRAGHPASRAVTTRTEALPHGTFLPDQEIRGGAHAPWDEDGLAGKGAG